IMESESKSRFQPTVERFLGKLSKEQEKIIKAQANEIKPDPALRVKNRITVLTKFDEQLEPYSSEAFAGALNDFFTHPEKWNDSEALQVQELRHQKQMQVLAQVLKLLSEKQKKHLIEEWDELIQDLKSGAL
ncbi:MAG: hypothetical protein ACK5V3_06225, partial [Bdellovibrionales bacterium]